MSDDAVHYGQYCLFGLPNEERQRLRRNIEAYEARIQGRRLRWEKMEHGRRATGIRKGWRVKPRPLTSEELVRFRQFMYEEIPFKGDHICLHSGPNEGTYVFADKQDAALFKLFWG